MNIVKEAVECEYWLELLYESDYLEKSEFSSIRSDCGKLN
ncbi:MAG: four helix bundle protein [Euryarchaeota archaeon]|nr:four helix bundle protein [Euryarchaeota archaeon]